jgi:hypothetical protein
MYVASLCMSSHVCYSLRSFLIDSNLIQTCIKSESIKKKRRKYFLVSLKPAEGSRESIRRQLLSIGGHLSFHCIGGSFVDWNLYPLFI